YLFRFVFDCSAAHPLLPSFPTRRSSDLTHFREIGCPRAAAFGSPRTTGSRASVLQFQASPARPSHQPPPPATDVHRRSRGCLRRSEEHTSELQSRGHLVCRLLLEKKKTK